LSSNQILFSITCGGFKRAWEFDLICSDRKIGFIFIYFENKLRKVKYLYRFPEYDSPKLILKNYHFSSMDRCFWLNDSKRNYLCSSGEDGIITIRWLSNKLQLQHLIEVNCQKELKRYSIKNMVVKKINRQNYLILIAGVKTLVASIIFYSKNEKIFHGETLFENIASLNQKQLKKSYKERIIYKLTNSDLQIRTLLVQQNSKKNFK